MTARENLTRAENALRNLIARDAGDPIWDQPLVLAETPRAARERVNAATAVARSQQNRPELQELASRLDRQDVEIDAALDRVRPQVDLVASYSGRGLAGTRNPDAFEPFGPIVLSDDLRGGLGQSLLTLGGNEFPDAALGVSVVIPIGNTAAKQDVVIARALRRQSSATLDAAKQRVALEVRNALAALESAEQRIEAAKATRAAAEVQLQAERTASKPARRTCSSSSLGRTISPPRSSSRPWPSPTSARRRPNCPAPWGRSSKNAGSSWNDEPFGVR